MKRYLVSDTYDLDNIDSIDILTYEEILDFDMIDSKVNELYVVGSCEDGGLWIQENCLKITRMKGKNL